MVLLKLTKIKFLTTPKPFILYRTVSKNINSFKMATRPISAVDLALVHYTREFISSLEDDLQQATLVQLREQRQSYLPKRCVLELVAGGP